MNSRLTVFEQFPIYTLQLSTSECLIAWILESEGSFDTSNTDFAVGSVVRRVLQFALVEILPEHVWSHRKGGWGSFCRPARRADII